MKVGIILGSISDREIAQEALDIFKKFGVEAEMKVISAHRTPVRAHEFASHAESNGYEVLIAIAGKAAHLAGVLASLTTIPVIGVPVKGSDLGGLDALLSTVQMPGGIPVATVGINGGKNAAILAVEILALNNSGLKDKLRYYKKELDMEVEKMNEQLED